jgi:hypothetical protein
VWALVVAGSRPNSESMVSERIQLSVMIGLPAPEAPINPMGRYRTLDRSLRASQVVSGGQPGQGRTCDQVLQPPSRSLRAMGASRAIPMTKLKTLRPRGWPGTDFTAGLKPRNLIASGSCHGSVARDSQTNPKGTFVPAVEFDASFIQGGPPEKTL